MLKLTLQPSARRSERDRLEGQNSDGFEGTGAVE